MPIQQPSPPIEPDGNARKRVCKACDRCRLKKSKCDGASPCSRCQTDNAICVFGERRKSHDKVYPKGYVEMLERQQAQLVAGLQELYKRSLSGQGWSGAPLRESTNGHPLTHDILERLGALKPNSKDFEEEFEEDLLLLQRRLLENGAGLDLRRNSSVSESDNCSSPFADMMSPEAALPTPFSTTFTPQQPLPTPPNDSPLSSASRPRSLPKRPMESESPNPMKIRLESGPAPGPAWLPSSTAMTEDNMDFIRRYDNNTAILPSTTQLDQHVAPTMVSNPCLTMLDWNDDEEFRAFLNPSIV
ncbi:hypothetical protein L228DRAFT_251744 [Xylona heveae TC161]|uniref:Zn(2)-C6 fungal-type domain-containing protein n=1 Tax=Xylona heveae (strain CBS 132557 / TC161) TaxID=1328760 RepID=A0A164ZAU6_XYLHT|nr:hypothetical protein L228DRAFT_251744 [Xylona heveae TC161]KZF18878.1 hypothetical protein L228DRAFT_251744 [Xylona heveae TC161]